MTKFLSVATHYISEHVHSMFHNLYHNLSEHPIYGFASGVLMWIINQIPVSVDAQYQNTWLHYVALYVKDIGIICTALIAILSLIFYLKEKISNRLKKRNSNRI